MLVYTQIGNFSLYLDADVGKRGHRGIAKRYVQTPHSAVTEVVPSIQPVERVKLKHGLAQHHWKVARGDVFGETRHQLRTLCPKAQRPAAPVVDNFIALVKRRVVRCRKETRPTFYLCRGSMSFIEKTASGYLHAGNKG